MHRAKSNDKTSFAVTHVRCSHCGHHERIKPVRSHGHHQCSFVLMVYRDRNKHSGLFDDRQGRIFLMILLALGLPDDEVENLASWITLKELQAIRTAARRFDPTPENIGKLIDFTDAEREYYGGKYNLYSIWSSESDWKAESEERAKSAQAKRNAKRKAKRQEEKDALIAACSDPMEIAVAEVMLRVSRRPGVSDRSVPTIIRTILRDGKYDDVFPQVHDAHRVAIHHALDRLERRKVVETETIGPRGAQVRHATLLPKKHRKPVRTGFRENVSAKQGVKPVGPVAQAEEYGGATENPCGAAAVKGLSDADLVAATVPLQAAQRVTMRP